MKATLTISEDKDAAVEQVPISAEAMKRWKTDPATRAEFGENFDTYAAYERATAAGRIKISGPQRAKESA